MFLGLNRSGISIFLVKSSITGNRLVSVPFSTLSDPLVSAPEDLDFILQGLLSFYKRNNIDYIEINSSFSDVLQASEILGVSRSYIHHYIPIDNTLEILKKSFHYNCIQRPIRKSLKSGLVFKHGIDENDLCEFYKLYLTTRKRLCLPPIPYSFFSHLWKEFGNTNNLSLMLSTYESDPVSGMLLFKFNRKVCLEFVVDNGIARERCPNHFLYWAAIQEANREGSEIVSLGRTPIDNHNLILFKSRWGTKATILSDYYYPKEAAMMKGDKEVSWKYKMIRNVSRYSPDPVFSLLGRFCYRHLG